jgi:hypothetical protein
VHHWGFVAVWLMLVASFVVYAGCFSYLTFMYRVRSLRQQFDPLAQMEKVKADVKEAEADVNYGLALTVALAAMGSDATFTDRSRAIGMLQLEQERLGKRGPTDRRTNLYLARLHRLLDHYDSAIDVLSRFIQAKEAHGERDDDLADGHYNRACYNLLRMAQAADEATKARIKEEAYKDLRISIELNRANARDAVKDEDFAAIRDEAQFKALTSDVQTTAALPS